MMKLRPFLKKLQEIEAQEGNIDVVVACKEMMASLNNVFEIVVVSKVDVEMLSKGDGDGFTIDNSERPTLIIR